MANPSQTGPFLRNGIDSLRQVEWGKSWNWDMQFLDAPAPFNEWFPASEIDHGIAHVNSYEWQAGNSTLKAPQSTVPKELRCTFHDNDENVLEEWLDEWVNGQMFSDGRVQTLSEAARTCMIAKLTNTRQVVSISDYLVYPEGGINTVRDSQSNMLIHVVTFNIVGRTQAGQRGTQDSRQSAPLQLQELTNTPGRTIIT